MPHREIKRVNMIANLHLSKNNHDFFCRYAKTHLGNRHFGGFEMLCFEYVDYIHKLHLHIIHWQLGFRSRFQH